MDLNHRNLAPHLKDIMNNYIAITEDDKRRSIRLVKTYLEQYLLPTIKKADSLFKEIVHNNVYWTGSMYDRLRVKEASEFDINIILLLPSLLNLKPDVNIGAPGFAAVQLPDVTRLPALRKFCDSENFLLASNIRYWMQSSVHRGLNLLQNKHQELRLTVTYSVSGPAVTLHIMYQSGTIRKQIDVDLVPVLQFPQNQWPASARQDYKADFFLVPKSELYNNRMWRLGFSQSERYKVLYNKGCIKMIIRLIKCLRDNEDQLKSLASYHIKVVVMYMIDTEVSCNESNLGPLFMLALKRLHKHAQIQSLPSYWCREHDLWRGKDPDNLSNISNRLFYIMRDISRTPGNVKNYYKKTVQEAIRIEEETQQQGQLSSSSWCSIS